MLLKRQRGDCKRVWCSDVTLICKLCRYYDGTCRYYNGIICNNRFVCLSYWPTTNYIYTYVTED